MHIKKYRFEFQGLNDFRVIFSSRIIPYQSYESGQKRVIDEAVRQEQREREPEQQRNAAQATHQDELARQQQRQRQRKAAQAAHQDELARQEYIAQLARQERIAQRHKAEQELKFLMKRRETEEQQRQVMEQERERLQNGT